MPFNQINNVTDYSVFFFQILKKLSDFVRPCLINSQLIRYSYEKVIIPDQFLKFDSNKSFYISRFSIYGKKATKSISIKTLTIVIPD